MIEENINMDVHSFLDNTNYFVVHHKENIWVEAYRSAYILNEDRNRICVSYTTQWDQYLNKYDIFIRCL